LIKECVKVHPCPSQMRCMQCQMLHDKNLAKPFNDTFASGVVVKHGGYGSQTRGAAVELNGVT